MLVNHRLVGAPRCAIMITWHSFTGSYPHSYPHGVPEPVPSAIMEVEHQGHHSHKVAVLWRPEQTKADFLVTRMHVLPVWCRLAGWSRDDSGGLTTPTR